MSISGGRGGALLLLVALAGPVPVPAQSGPGIVSLYEGRAVARGVGDESITYTFDAQAGRTYLLEVGPSGQDLRLSVAGPGGGTWLFDSPLFGDESEFVLLEDASGGRYRIRLLAEASRGPVGEGTIRIDNVRLSKTQRKAWRLLSDAAADYARGDAAARERALIDYQAAASLFRAARNPRPQARALYAAAMLQYWVMGEWHLADELAARAAQAYAAANEPGLQANALLLRAMTLTEALNETADKPSLLGRISGYLAESYAMHERLGNVGQLARVRYFNALSHLNAGRYDAAKQYYSAAAALFHELEDWQGERGVRLDRAVIDLDLGNSAQAVAALEALRAAEASVHPRPARADVNFMATLLDQLGAAHKHAGSLDDALAAYSRARELHRDVGDQHGEAESLHGIGGTYLALGDLASARAFLRQAEAAARASSNGRVLGVVYTTLGSLEYADARYEAAKAAQTAALEFAPAQSPIRAHRQVLLARTHIALGEFDQARRLAQDALALADGARSPRTEADALQQLGRAYLGLRQPQKSIEVLGEAEALYGTLALPDGLADVESALARSLAATAMAHPDAAARVAGLDEALTRSARSLAYAERLLDKVSSPELRAYYRATRRGYYENHIELLLTRSEMAAERRRSYVAEALATSERARARMTMDLLNEASVDLHRHVDPALAGEVDALVEQLTAYARQREQMLRVGGLDARSRAQLAGLADELTDLQHRLALKQVELRRGSRRYSALTAPATIRVAEIQALIDPDSVVLQYYLGEDRSFVWVVTRETLELREIADRRTVDAAAEALIASLRTPVSSAAARAARAAAMRSVSELVLQPVADLIGARRVIVVADGSLNYLPFHALALETDGDADLLLESREVVALPSMSVLAALRDRPEAARPQKPVAIFADPVFDRTDARFETAESDTVAASTTAGPTPAPPPRPSLAGDLPRLPGTRMEAMSVAALVADEEPLVALGFDANLSQVLERDLSDYRILHFATHGKVDRESPALSALVLSRFDPRGRPLDGYLRLHDIYRLEINADLVVLSACETGLGTDINGEGLVGLAQGFLYAGARSLLISLWSVPDRATYQLMTRFYGHLIEDGLHPAAALRRAQLSMASERQWRDPYFWGAFILLGDWA